MPEVNSSHHTGQRHTTSIVYEKTTGTVVFIHHTELMKGASAPESSEIERQTLRLASQVRGMDETNLGVLSVDPHTFNPNMTHTVDPTTHTLKSVPKTPSRKRGAADLPN